MKFALFLAAKKGVMSPDAALADVVAIVVPNKKQIVN